MWVWIIFAENHRLNYHIIHGKLKSDLYSQSDKSNFSLIDLAGAEGKEQEDLHCDDGCCCLGKQALSGLQTVTALHLFPRDEQVVGSERLCLSIRINCLIAAYLDLIQFSGQESSKSFMHTVTARFKL